MGNEIRFNCVPDETEITLELKGGVEKKVIIREMSGAERDKYLNSMSDRMKMNSNGDVIGIKSFDGMQASLLALCLYDEQDKLIPIQEIQSYPAKAQTGMFKIAQKLNALDTQAVEDAKNE